MPSRTLKEWIEMSEASRDIVDFAESIRKEAMEEMAQEEFRRYTERAKLIQPINCDQGTRFYWTPPDGEGIMIDFNTEQGQAFMIEYYRRKQGWNNAK